MPVPSLNQHMATAVAKKKHQKIYTERLHQLAEIEIIKDWVDEITTGITQLQRYNKDQLHVQPIIKGLTVTQTKTTQAFAKIYNLKKQWSKETSDTVPDFMLHPVNEDLPTGIGLLEDIQIISCDRPEPFNNDNLWQWLQDMPHKDSVRLELTTNASTDPTPYKYIIDGFKERQFTIRIGGHGAMNDYVNAGSSFNDVVMNIKKFKKFWPNEVTILVEIHAGNVLRLDKLFDWLYAEDIRPELKLIAQPSYFHIQAIPMHLRQQSIKKIAMVMLDRKDDNIHYHMLLTEMQKLPYVKTLHEKFILNIKRLDQLRKTKFFQLVPELKLDRSWEK